MATHPLWKKSFTSIRQNPKVLFWIFLLDVGFLALFLLLNYAVNLLFPSTLDVVTQAQKNVLLFVGLIALFVLYVAIILLAYSFFSLIILGNIKSLSKTHTHDFSMLKQMFLINLLLFIVFFVFFILFNIISVFLTTLAAWASLLVLVLFAVFALLFYVFWNLAHSAFILGHEFWACLKKSFRNLFSRAYLGLFLSSIIVIAVYVALVIGASLLFKNTFIAHYQTFVTVGNILTVIVVYALFTFNRVYFFFIAEKHIGHTNRRNKTPARKDGKK